MWFTIGRLISVLIAIGYVAAMAYSEGGMTAGVLKLSFFLLIPLALIWFPEEIGSFTGHAGRGGFIDTKTPSILISIFGWLFLIGLPMLIYFLAR